MSSRWVLITAHFPSLGTPGHAAFELGSQRHLTPKGTSRYPQGKNLVTRWTLLGPYEWGPHEWPLERVTGIPSIWLQLTNFVKWCCDMITLFWGGNCYCLTSLIALPEELWQPTELPNLGPWTYDLFGKQTYAMLKNKSSKDIRTVPNGDNMEKHDMIKSKTTHLSIFKQKGKKYKINLFPGWCLSAVAYERLAQ